MLKLADEGGKVEGAEKTSFMASLGEIARKPAWLVQQSFGVYDDLVRASLYAFQDDNLRSE
jgi:hypothetical protein